MYNLKDKDMKEEWKNIVGYEGYYMISNHGRVYSNRNKIVLKNREGKNGYLDVALSVNGKQKLKKIHRIVYESFIGELKKGLVIDHIDNNPKNNHVSNLRQVSSRKNTSRGHVNKSGYTGVRLFKQIDKYGSEIQIEGRIHFLGVYDTAKEASCKYQKALSDWEHKREKPYEVKEGFKLCRICNVEKSLSEFREAKTVKGTKSYYYACLDCESQLKKDRYYKSKNK